jgi:hypothetical protein
MTFGPAYIVSDLVEPDGGCEGSIIRYPGLRLIIYLPDYKAPIHCSLAIQPRIRLVTEET